MCLRKRVNLTHPTCLRKWGKFKFYMIGKNNFPSLKHRTIILLVNLILFYFIFTVTSGRWLPTGGLESVWLLSAAALWFLNLLSAPWFLPPRDSIANGISALSVLITIELATVPNFKDQLNLLRWIGVTYSVVIVVISLLALFLYDRPQSTVTSRLYFRMVGIFGKAEITYSIAAIISIVGAYQSNFSRLACLLVIWVMFMVAKPVEGLAEVIHMWCAAKMSSTIQKVVGTIDRIDYPNIVRVRLSTGSSWNQNILYVAAMPDGYQYHVLALFGQPQGVDFVGTGLCVAKLSKPVILAAGKVAQTQDDARASEFIEFLSGTNNAKLIGFVVENSTISFINFEIALTNDLEEGEVVFARIEGVEVFYQIIDAETYEENFDKNPRGTQIVRAAQLGRYEVGKGFVKYPWLPTMNTPLFRVKERVFEHSQISDREFNIGSVPSTNIAITANIDNLIAYHTAILGVTGTGKTELALDIIRKAVCKDIKVFCVDCTGDYRQRLADLDPMLPGPTQQQSEDLEAKLFAAETGAYNAGKEKQVLKEAVDDLRESTIQQINDFMTGRKSIAILELLDITNSKASLRITELYLSAIMMRAKKYRDTRQILLVLEEAHTIVPETGGSGFDYDTQWVVSRIGQIALQGRKYGVGLLVITQRTALVSKTILSQCNTFLTHSLIDQTSLNFLESVYSASHTRLISNLPNFHFLAFGKGLSSERPIILRHEFDQAKKDASDTLRQLSTVTLI
jgi:hypothetical protein